MKKKYFFMACLAAIFMVSACNDDDDKAAVLPSAISNLTATPLEGGVLLEWEVPRRFQPVLCTDRLYSSCHRQTCE